MNEKIKVIIAIAGGRLVDVLSNDPSLEVEVVDIDDSTANGEDGWERLEQAKYNLLNSLETRRFSGQSDLTSNLYRCSENNNTNTGDKTMQITKQQAAGIITRNRGKIFTVTFTKRTTGEERVLNGRQGVTKHLKGGPAAYNFAEKKLLPVFDCQLGAYRSIPVEGINELKIMGKTFQVV